MIRFIRFLLPLCVALPTWGAVAQERALEERIKTAYLYNVLKFVRWPGEASGEPLRLCVAGDDAVARLIPGLHGRQIHERPVEVKRRAAEGNACDVIYLAASEAASLERWLGAGMGRAILTVADMERFAERGGMVELDLRGGRVHLRVNLAQMERSGLRLGAKALEISEIVGER